MHRRRTALLTATVLSIVMVCVHIACTPDPSGKEPDTDGDGLSDREELTVYGTSPLLADSDGDGISDYDEIVKFGFDPEHDPYSFNPRIADVPEMTLSIVGPPILTIQFTDEHGATTTFETSQEDGVTQSFTHGISTTQARSDSLTTAFTRTHEESVSFTLGGRVLADAGLPDAEPETPSTDAAVEGPVAGTSSDQGSGDGPTITLTDAVSTTVSPTTTFATTLTLSEEEQIQYSRVLTATQSYAQSHNITAVGAFLKVTTILKNRSRVGFRVTNISLGATVADGAGGLLPVQNLNIDQGIITNFIPFSLGPGEQTGPTVFISPQLTLETASVILANAHAVLLRVATYELVDGTGKPFAINATEVAAKTALVVIDYGHGLPEIYQVATKLDPAHPGVSAFKVLHDILRMPYRADPSSGLQSVRDVSATWRVERRRRVGPDTTVTPYGENGEPYDFDTIELKAGDTLYLSAVGPSSEPGFPERNPAVTQGPGPDAGLGVKGPGGEQLPPEAGAPQPAQPNPAVSRGQAPDGG